MKSIRHIQIFSSFLVVLFFSSCLESDTETGNSPGLKTVNAQNEKSVYQIKSLEEYGADEWAMKTYVMAFLKEGPNRDRSPDEASELQNAHMENIGRMADEGKLLAAGPFLGEGELRGIYIFDVKTIAEAEALTKTDPAIQAGSLEMELIEWYGSAAMMAVNDIHNLLKGK